MNVSFSGPQQSLKVDLGKFTNQEGKVYPLAKEYNEAVDKGDYGKAYSAAMTAGISGRGTSTAGESLGAQVGKLAQAKAEGKINYMA